MDTQEIERKGLERSLPSSAMPRLVVDHDAAGVDFGGNKGVPLTSKRGNMLKRFILFTLVTGLVSLGVVLGRGKLLEDRSAATGDVEAPSVAASVFALGRLEPAGEVLSIASPSGAGDARVERLNVHEGMQVDAGCVLAVLDSEQRLLAAVHVAEESVQQARRRLEKTELEVNTAAERAAAMLRSNQAQLANGQLQLRRLERLRASNAVALEELEQQRLAVEMAEQAVVDAQLQVARYAAQEGRELADIRLAVVEVRTAEASLSQARANLEQAYIRAPLDGEILRVNVRMGERVGQLPLLEMGNTREMWARVEVYESEVARLKIGQTVSMTGGPLQVPLLGRLERITNIVQQQSVISALPAASTDARVVEVWVRLDSESSELAARFVNLQVRAEFILGETNP